MFMISIEYMYSNSKVYCSVLFKICEGVFQFFLLKNVIVDIISVVKLLAYLASIMNF